MRTVKVETVNLIVLIGVVLSVSAGAGFSQPLPQQLGPGPHVKYHPVGTAFTATIVKTYKMNGKVWIQEHITHSARVDQSTSRSLRRFAADGQMVVNNTVLYDPGRSLRIYVEHLTQSTHHSVLPPHANAPSARIDIASRATERSVLLGYQVYRIETQRSSSAHGEFIEESWIAPALDNFPLRVIAKETSDGVIRLWETEVTSVIPAALPQESFEVPPGYVERMPSEVAKLVHDRFGKPPVSTSQTSVWDSRYLQRIPATMASLVRSRPALSDSRRPGETRRVTRETPDGSGEGLKTEVSEDLSGPSKSDRPNLFARLLFLGICLIVVSGVLLVRRYHLRIREPRV